MWNVLVTLTDYKLTLDIVHIATHNNIPPLYPLGYKTPLWLTLDTWELRTPCSHKALSCAHVSMGSNVKNKDVNVAVPLGKETVGVW